MKLKFVKLDTTIGTQVEKIYEEVNEFVEAIKLEDDENLIEEFWDVVQSMMGVIDLRGLSKEELMQGLEKHYEKLEGRGHKFK
jgi:phosphoribosyl-ATP pyrophosphohydrolase